MFRVILLWLGLARRRGALARLTVCVALPLLAALASVPAHAHMTCNVQSGGNRAIDFGTASVPIHAAVGSMVKSVNLTPTFTPQCAMTTQAPAATSATLTITFHTAATPQAGYTDVYPTNIAGLGVRYKITANLCGGVLYRPFEGPDFTMTCPFTGFSIGGSYIVRPMAMSAELVVTGPLPPGDHVITQVPRLEVFFEHSDQTGKWQQQDAMTGSASGTLLGQTCTVLQTGFYLTLDDVNVRDFQAGVNTTAAPQPFNLSLECPAGLKVAVTFTDSTTPGNVSDVLTLAPASTASGVGIQLVNTTTGTPVSYGPESAVAGNTHQWVIGTSTAGNMLVPMAARYIRTGNMTPGSVNGLAVFTMSYQ